MALLNEMKPCPAMKFYGFTFDIPTATDKNKVIKNVVNASPTLCDGCPCSAVRKNNPFSVQCTFIFYEPKLKNSIQAYERYKTVFEAVLTRIKECAPRDLVDDAMDELREENVDGKV